MRQYIGITGFTSSTVVGNVLAKVPSGPALVMIGVLLSHDNIGGCPHPKWPRRYPISDRISRLFHPNIHAFNLIHYDTRETELLTDQMIVATSFGGPNLHGIQLNLKSWPSPQDLEAYRNSYPSKSIVLQVNQYYLDSVNHSARALAHRLLSYKDLVDHVLLDVSRGHGITLNTTKLYPYLEAISVKVPQMGLTVAGGLGPNNLNLLDHLLGHFPNLSFDAQSSLRDHNDHMSWPLVCAYLSAALQTLGYIVSAPCKQPED